MRDSRPVGESLLQNRRTWLGDMATLKNVSGVARSVSNEPWLPSGVALVWAVNEEKKVFNEDFNKSNQLQMMVAEGILTVIDQKQPGDTGAAPNASVGFGGVPS